MQSKVDITIASHIGIKNFIKDKIDQHRKTYDPNHIRDLCDIYIERKYNDVVGLLKGNYRNKYNI